MSIKIENIDKLKDLIGREVAVSDWIEVSQARIDRFAEAVCDTHLTLPTTLRARLESWSDDVC